MSLGAHTAVLRDIAPRQVGLRSRASGESHPTAIWCDISLFGRPCERRGLGTAAALRGARVDQGPFEFRQAAQSRDDQPDVRRGGGRFKETISLAERVTQETGLLRTKPNMKPIVALDQVLRLVRQYATASRNNEWLNSPGMHRSLMQSL